VAISSFAYLDSSALVKLVVAEPETRALRAHVAGRPLGSSEIALVEVVRACKRAGAPTVERAARRLVSGAFLVRVDRALLERAAELTSGRLRSLDAIHLASALHVRPDELIAYDRRLLEAAAGAGLTVSSPGA
jgi:predicted nucleic acid-binding protein